MHSIQQQLDCIYDDLICNVTRIYGRQELHLAIDLVYHSPISFHFGGKYIRKGYPEILILGDTRTGKTQCAEALLEHYTLGAVAQAEAMSYAGLVGGLQKMFDTKFDVTWGKLPQNNRRLLIIDETSGMPKDLMPQLSSIRSSGIATIEKIASAKTEAKTRIIWLSNPNSRLTISEFSSGVEAVQSLADRPEDVARWDMAIIVAKEDVRLDEIKEQRKKRVPHRFTTELCRDLVLWAWTREPNEIEFAAGAEEACHDYAEKLSDKYCGDFTIVIAAEQPIKMARMSVALAARLFSTTTGHNLVVTPAHVEYIYHYLQRVYDARSFGYDTWSSSHTVSADLVDEKVIQAFCHRLGRMGCMKVLEMRLIRLQNISELLGIEPQEARVMLSQLIMNNALKQTWDDSYRKTTAFNKRLKHYTKTLPQAAETPTARAEEEDGL